MSNKTNRKGKILSARQAADYLGISLSYLYKLTYGRILPYFKPNGKLIYFLEKDLACWLTSKKIPSNEVIVEKKAKVR